MRRIPIGVSECSSRHKTVIQCWFYVWPLSVTMDQNQTNAGWTSRISWGMSTESRAYHQQSVAGLACVELWTSQPDAIRRSIISRWSASTARCRGVRPVTGPALIGAFTTAPASSSSLTTSACPYWQAKCRAVTLWLWPNTALCLTLPPAASSTPTRAVWPCWLARARQVHPPGPGSFIRAPCSSSWRHRPT